MKGQIAAGRRYSGAPPGGTVFSDGCYALKKAKPCRLGLARVYLGAIQVTGAHRRSQCAERNEVKGTMTLYFAEMKELAAEIRPFESPVHPIGERPPSALTVHFTNHFDKA